MALYDKEIDWKASSREWDIRVNLGDGDINAEAEHFITLCKEYITKVQVAYLLVGGIEVGDKTAHSSFKKAHLHVALKAINRVFPKAVKDHLKLNCLSDGTSRHYYLSIRDDSLPYSGWRDHHIKLTSKVDITKLILFEHGSLPADKRKLEHNPEFLTKAEFNKKKANDRFQQMLDIYFSGDFDDREMFVKYGQSWAKAKADIKKTMPPVSCPDPPLGKFPDGKNLLIFGKTGTGKSLYVKWKYPNVYQRDPLELKWYNGFQPALHSHIYYEDMDIYFFNKKDITPSQWKVWLDPYSTYQGAMKYESPIDNIHHPVIVTSQYEIHEWFMNAHINAKDDIMAMQRRFNAVDIKDLLRKEGIRLKPNLPPHQKPEDCFEPWDYENNCSPVEDQPEVPIAVVSVT